MSDTVVVAAPPPPEQVAAVADAAVAVAEIQADRDVALAEISADVTETVAEIEADNDEDMRWLRAELDSLRTDCATNAAISSALTERCASLESQVTALTETVTIQAAAQVELAALLNPSPPLEDQTEPTEESADADAPVVLEPVASARAVRKRKWL